MTAPSSPRATPELVSGIRAEVDAIAKRATDTRLRLKHGEAVTGVTGLIEIENRCLDVLALLDTFDRACLRVTPRAAGK
jgi:hypothetical protein